MALILCPFCNTGILPKADGSCPACGRNTREDAEAVLLLVPPPDSADAEREPDSEDLRRVAAARFAIRAAGGSCVAPILSVAVSMLGSGYALRNKAFSALAPVIVTGLLLAVLGFALACYALTKIKQHGNRGILIPAVIGLLLSSGVLYLWLNAFWMAEKKRAERAQSATVIVTPQVS